MESLCACLKVDLNVPKLNLEIVRPDLIRDLRGDRHQHPSRVLGLRPIASYPYHCLPVILPGN